MKPQLILTAICLLAGCDTSGTVEVDWSNYHPEVKERIDGMAVAADCDGLQREFDIAHANDGGQRARTGTGNSALMGYIISKLEAVGC